MSASKASPYHRRRRQDLESASSRASEFDEELSSGPFDITITKHVSIEPLKCWRNDAPTRHDMIRNNRIWIHLNRWSVKGLADLLKTNLEKGIVGDDAIILKRRNAFGSNYSTVVQRIFVGTLIDWTIRKLKDRAQQHIINTLIWGIYKLS